MYLRINFKLLLCLTLFTLGCSRNVAEEISTYKPTETIFERKTNLLEVSLIDHSISVEMVLIEEGEFQMGSNLEPPLHVVYLDAFWIDRTEVTNEQFIAFVNETGHKTSAERLGNTIVFDTRNDSSGKEVSWQILDGFTKITDLDRYLDYPVIHVSWEDAQSYCQWRGTRLPTEAEWEKAALGKNDLRYPWVTQFDGNLLNSCDSSCPRNLRDEQFNDGFPTVAPVDSFPRDISKYDAVDLMGNVSEWVSDFYDPIYYSYSPRDNPQGPSADEIRTNLIQSGNSRETINLELSHVIRGGSWVHVKPNASLDYRSSGKSFLSTDELGFRCALSIN